MRSSLLFFLIALSFNVFASTTQVPPIDSALEKKAATWVASLQLNDPAKEGRLTELIATHLTEVRSWNNSHPYSTVPAGIDPSTGRPLSNMDRQIIAVSAMPHSVHDSLMAGLHRDLTNEQVDAILDKYTIGKVAFTLKGYKAIVPDLKPEEEAVIRGNLEQAREQAIDYKNVKEISAIFEIYKTKCEQYLNSNGRNWHALFKAYVNSVKAKKAVLVSEYLYDTASFPECHAATIAETPKGLIAAFFGGTKERNPDVCIYVCRKDQGSAKWTAPMNVANGIQNAKLRYACWNPVLYQIPGGDLLLFYKVGPSPAKWKGWLIRSKDGGVSWSKPWALPEGFLGPIKDQPVALPDGSLLCPSSTEGNGWKVHFEIARKGAKRWEMAGPVPTADSLRAIQPTILKYKDGTIEALTRSENRAILSTTSRDNGQTWSPLTPTSLPNNNSGIDATTLADGRQLLVYNHVLPPAGKAKGERSPLNVAVSPDGKTWYASLVLEDDHTGQYSYPSVIQSADGKVHIVYTWHRKKIKYVEIDPSKMPKDKIVDGVWPESIKK
ncbi:MAG TPA: exo-alpha-sialidase [Puia sp.]|nr:exo-alpha-sialidase [Puia sp.]